MAGSNQHDLVFMSESQQWYKPRKSDSGSAGTTDLAPVKHMCNAQGVCADFCSSTCLGKVAPRSSAMKILVCESVLRALIQLFFVPLGVWMVIRMGRPIKQTWSVNW